MSLLGSLARGILSLAFGALLGSTIAAAAPEISVTPILAPAGALVGAMLAHRPLSGVSLDGGRARAVRAVVGLSLGLTLLALVAGSAPGAILSVWVMAGVTVGISGLTAVAGASSLSGVTVASGLNRIEIESGPRAEIA